MTCTCFYCTRDRRHPESHQDWARLSDHLLVPESLRPEDRVRVISCTTCGHKIHIATLDNWGMKETK